MTGGFNTSAATRKRASFVDHMTTQAGLTIPKGIANFLLPQPKTLKQAIFFARMAAVEGGDGRRDGSVRQKHGVGPGTALYQQGCRNQGAV